MTLKGQNIYLQLGDSQLINIDLESEVSALEEVVLTGTKDSDFNSKKQVLKPLSIPREFKIYPHCQEI